MKRIASAHVKIWLEDDDNNPGHLLVAHKALTEGFVSYEQYLRLCGDLLIKDENLLPESTYKRYTLTSVIL